MYLYAKGNLGQTPTTLQPHYLAGPAQPPQCEAIPEKYKLRDKNKLTSGRVNCPTRADAARILRATVARAVAMLDNTIGELIRAREAACRGEPLGWPALGDVTACWLKYRLGVCIDDLSVWTRGTFRKSLTEPVSVAEVIRRLAQPRNLLASNAVTYVCDATCPGQRVAWVVARNAAGECIPGTPDRTIHLCPPFWSSEQAPFREQHLIHEAAHLTHCDPHGTTQVAASVGWAECLAQFVVATNGKKIAPGWEGQCGFTKRCGPVSKGCRKSEVGKNPTLPDWHP
jgi:hypothetical protein